MLHRRNGAELLATIKDSFRLCTQVTPSCSKTHNTIAVYGTTISSVFVAFFCHTLFCTLSLSHINTQTYAFTRVVILWQRFVHPNAHGIIIYNRNEIENKIKLFVQLRFFPSLSDILTIYRHYADYKANQYGICLPPSSIYLQQKIYENIDNARTDKSDSRIVSFPNFPMFYAPLLDLWISNDSNGIT